MENDQTIWEWARTNGYHILTKDSDFNILQQVKGYPPKVIWIRSGNVSTAYIIDLISARIDAIYEFIAHPDYGILEIN